MSEHSEYIVFWKEGRGNQVSTTADAHDEPVRRDVTFITTNDIPILTNDAEVFTALELANGDKFAITPELARQTLGWDV